MPKRLIRTQHTKEYLLLALMSLTLSTSVALVPIIYELGVIYPNNIENIHLTLTLPPLFMTLSAILVARLERYVNKKDMLIGAYVLIGLSGFLPVIGPSFKILLFSRAILGIGLGFLNPIVSSYPRLVFDDQELNKAEGVYASFSSLGAVVFTFLGVLSLKISGQLTLAIPLVNVICIIPIIFIYPKEVYERTISRPQRFQKTLIPYLILIFITIMLTITLPLNLSLLNQEKDLLSLSSLALITSINAIIGFVTGFIYPVLKKKLTHHLLTVSLFITAISMVGLAFVETVFMFVILTMIFGLGTSLLNPYFVSLINEKSTKETVLKGMSALMVVMSIAQFLSPFIINPLASLMGDWIRQRFIISALMMMALIIITITSTRIALKESFNYYD